MQCSQFPEQIQIHCSDRITDPPTGPLFCRTATKCVPVLMVTLQISCLHTFSRATDMKTHTLHLSNSQCIQLDGKAGTVIHINHGELRLSLPVEWLSETLRRETHTLHAGNIYILPRNGLYHLKAKRQTQLSLPIPETSPGFIQRGIRRGHNLLCRIGRLVTG